MTILTQKDIHVLGWTPESTKGTPETNTAYEQVRGITQEISWGEDLKRESNWQSGEGPVPSYQTYENRDVDGRWHIRLAADYLSGDAATKSWIALCMGKNSLHTPTGRVISRGQKYVSFDAGGAGASREITVGDKVTQAAGASAYVSEILITSGAWADDDAAGILLLEEVSDTAFANDTAIQVGGVTYATADGASTEIWSELDSMTVWIKTKNVADTFVLAGTHIQKLTFDVAENGTVELIADLKILQLVETDPTDSTLPTHAFSRGLPQFKYSSSQSSMTVVRAGTSARLKGFSFVLDNGELEPIYKEGQDYPEDYVPDEFHMTGELNFYVKGAELWTIWHQDPNADKELTYTSGGTSEITAGSSIHGQTSGAVAIVKDVTLSSGAWADGDAVGSLKVNKVKGKFGASEEIISSDAATAGATLGGALTDPSTIDCAIVWSKNGGNEYLKFDLYNLFPTGKHNWKHTPQEGAKWMVDYPFECFSSSNFRLDVLA